ncbi:DNA internalization-related competence protein ComEC/Rec2 [Mitsuokella sp.]|uniref:DNA internalization-related competence protein ComEC/Rec2 n=1 Tax=Mitsuokella sp. TaxID=2049034 RepID=UPI003D7CAB84
MKTGQYPVLFLAGLLLMLAAGIAVSYFHPYLGNLGDFWGFGVSFWLMLGLPVFLLAVWMTWHSSRFCWLPLLLLFFLCGIFRLQSSMSLSEHDISRWAEQPKQEIRLSGTLLEEPRWQSVLAPDGSMFYKVRYLVQAEKVKSGGQWQAASGKCYVYARTTAKEEKARIGDGLTVGGTVRRPHGYQNPGQIDTELLLRADGITALLTAGKGTVHIEQRDACPLERFVADCRRHYRQSMEDVMPKEDAAAVFAMLFGGYEGIEPELIEDFQTTGIVHILSVSGSHISLVAAVMLWLASMLRLPRAISAVLVLGSIAFYSILAGCVPPVIRSALMGSLSFLALAFGRERESRYILLLTGIFMLMWQPLLLFHISFELSYLATAGLIFLAPVLYRWGRQRGIPSFMAMGLAITAAAQLASLPVLLWYFGQVSLSSLLANLLVVPILELMIVLGLFAGIAAFFLPFPGHLIFAFDSLLLGVAAELAHVLAKIPGGLLYLPAMKWQLCLLYYFLLGFLLFCFCRRDFVRTHLYPYRRQAAAVCLSLFLVYGLSQLLATREMAVHFLDVGQGDAVLVVTPHGRAMMFDTGGTRDGSFDIGSKVDVPYLLHHDVHALDAIFLSHAHEDHAQGCSGILKKIPVERVYMAKEGLDAYARSLQFSDADPVLRKFQTAEEGHVFTLDGVKVEVLFAPPKPSGGGTGNEVSNVYRVSYGRASFLFTGDLVKEQEAKLIAAGKNLHANVLKAGHHGSATSSSEAFLENVAPSYGVFCVGFENSFGHPKPEIVQRYQEHGIRTLRTDRDGAVVFHTDGKTMRVETYADTKILR